MSGRRGIYYEFIRAVYKKCTASAWKIASRHGYKEIGVSASYLSDVERDRRTISREMAIRITRAFYDTIGGDYRDMYDALLGRAGLASPERICLLMLNGVFNEYKKMEQNYLEWSYHDEIERGLYGDLDKAIYGGDS